MEHRNNEKRSIRLKKEKVICLTCQRKCSIPEGKKGWCHTRINEGGKLYSLIYGEVSSRAALSLALCSLRASRFGRRLGLLIAITSSYGKFMSIFARQNFLSTLLYLSFLRSICVHASGLFHRPQTLTDL